MFMCPAKTLTNTKQKQKTGYDPLLPNESCKRFYYVLQEYERDNMITCKLKTVPLNGKANFKVQSSNKDLDFYALI